MITEDSSTPQDSHSTPPPELPAEPSTAPKLVGKIRHAILNRLINRRFLRDSGLLLLANIIVTALAMVRTPAITWVIPKEQVGIMGVVTSWLTFIRLLSAPGLDTASYHYIAKGQRWAFIVNLTYRLKWSLLSMAALLISALYWFQKDEAMLGWMFVVTGITFLPVHGLTASAGALVAQERFKDLFWYRILESLTDFVGFIPLLLSVWWVSQIVTFYGANQLATAIMLILYCLWIGRRLVVEGTPRLQPEDEREMIRYGKHQTALNAINVAQNRTDTLVVGLLLPLTTMADYSISLLLYEQLRRLWTIYRSVRYPRLVNLSRNQRFKRMAYEGIFITACFAIGGFGLLLGAAWLIPIILPPAYANSIGYMVWLTATFIVGIPGLFAEMYFLSEQDEKNQYIMRVASAVVGITLVASLVLIWGVNGVLLGRFLSSLVLSILGINLAIFYERRQAKKDLL